MKKKIYGTVAVLFIVALTLLNVQATKHSGNLALDDIAIMAAEENIQFVFRSLGCNHAWEGYFCYPHEDGEYCMHGGEVGVFCNDGKKEEASFTIGR